MVISIYPVTPGFVAENGDVDLSQPLDSTGVAQLSRLKPPCDRRILRPELSAGVRASNGARRWHCRHDWPYDFSETAS